MLELPIRFPPQPRKNGSMIPSWPKAKASNCPKAGWTKPRRRPVIPRAENPCFSTFFLLRNKSFPPQYEAEPNEEFCLFFCACKTEVLKFVKIMKTNSTLSRREMLKISAALSVLAFLKLPSSVIGFGDDEAVSEVLHFADAQPDGKMLKWE